MFHYYAALVYISLPKRITVFPLMKLLFVEHELRRDPMFIKLLQQL